MLKTFEVLYKDLNSEGDIADFSYFIQARSWAEAESKVPSTHRVHGCVVATVDYETGLRIDFDNLN